MCSNNEEILVGSNALGDLTDGHFKRQPYTLPELKEGEVELKAKFASVDPYVRLIMKGMLPAGTPVISGLVCEVSRVSPTVTEYKVGDLVMGNLPWRKCQNAAVKAILRKVDPTVASPSTALGVLGMPGVTAYFGVMDCLQPKAGQVAVVSGAAGAVGSLAGQILKLQGVRVIGIAGGKDKCEFVKNKLGFDECIDYKALPTMDDIKAALKALCPNGINMYFDNTGGHITDGVIDLLNKFGRVALCGNISSYNTTEPVKIKNCLMVAIGQSLTYKGFMAGDYSHRFAEFYAAQSAWVKEGKLVIEETFYDGFENLPKAMMGLFSGSGMGKAIVRI